MSGTDQHATAPRGRARGRRVGQLAAVLAVAASLGVGRAAMTLRDAGAARPRVAGEATASRLRGGTTSYTIEQGGVPLGSARATVAPGPGGITTTDEIVTELPIGGKLNRVTARLRAELTTALALRAFDLDVQSASGPLAVSGRIEADTTLVLAIAAGGAAADTQRVAVRSPLLLPTTVPLVVALGAPPAVGRRYAVTTFDPLAMASRDVRLTVVAESLFVAGDSAVRAWRLAPDGGGGFAGWVDAAGRAVRLEHPGGFTVRREAAGEARARPPRRRGAPLDSDILESSAIAASAPLRRGQLSRLTVRLTNVSLAGFAVHGGAQSLRGDLLTVTREPAAAGRAGYTLGTGDTTPRRFARELAAEPLLQVNAPAIRAAAARVAAGSRDPAVVAERLTRWVHDSIAEEITIGVPSATQVLASRRGDCNEHTQLYIALARAAGIPARGAAGLARVGGKFYYHAWPEVYLGRWVAVDPTFGEFPADAGHLRFVSGGLGRQAELLRLIGALRIEVVESR